MYKAMPRSHQHLAILDYILAFVLVSRELRTSAVDRSID